MNAFTNRLTLSVGAIAIALLTSCDHHAAIRGDRHLTTEQRPTSPFTTVNASGTFQIEWQAGAPAVSITTDSNLQEYVEVTNRGNELRLNSRGSTRASHGIKAVISSPTLASSRLTGACRLTAHQLAGDSFAIETAGASRVNLDGAVGQLLADMTGASNLQAAGLKTTVAEMSLTGASKADVTVAESLHVSIAGAGKVTYGGEPKKIEKSISGAGRVSRRE